MNDLETNLDILRNIINFAYECGYHEVGYDVLAEAMAGRDWQSEMKITAIKRDFSCDYLILPDGMNLKEEKLIWRNWYQERYCPDLNAGKRPEFVSFVQQLKNHGAVEPTTDQLEVWEDL